MADRITPAERSKFMSQVRVSGTAPERVIRSSIFRAGFRYRLNDKGLPGAPDIVLKRHRVAIFVHGCFWHRHQECRLSTVPKSNVAFWTEKLEKNAKRDQAAAEKLATMGWRVLVVWECATRGLKNLDGIGARVVSWLRGRRRIGEIRG